MAVLRAVENKRYLVRTATAGISSFVDPLGHVYSLSTAPEAVIRGEAFPLHDTTVYTRYGDWFAVLCLVLSTAALFLTQRIPDQRAHLNSYGNSSITVLIAAR